MKKFVFIFLTACCQQLCAQYSEQPHTIAIVTGPNWFQPLTSGLDGAPSFDARTGFSVGVDYTLHLTNQWHIKAGIHYSGLSYEYTVGPLTWPSEYTTGQYVYDPTLPRYLTERFDRRAFQYLTGIRYWGRGERWRFFADAESGITNITQEDVEGGIVRLHLGAGAGLSWHAPGGRLSVFFEPVVRFVFQDLRVDSSFGDNYRMLIPALEAGVRHHF
jgi:hypothetical protein